MVELRSLRYFLTVANERNITRAAKILHMTQPTLSRQMIELEKEMGTVFFIRGKRSLTLTDDGLLFKQQAEEIVELADRLEKNFLNRKDTIEGIISIGAVESVNSRVLAEYIQKFTKKYPDVRFELYSGMADYIKDKVERGILDIGLITEPVAVEKFDFVRMRQKETWGILLRKDHPLAMKKEITVEDIKELPLIMPKRPSDRNQLLNWIGCEEKHLNIPVTYDLLSNGALFVETGIGCAVCLDGTLSRHCSPDILFRTVLPENTTNSMILWKKNHLFHPATALFVQMLKEKENG